MLHSFFSAKDYHLKDTQNLSRTAMHYDTLLPHAKMQQPTIKRRPVSLHTVVQLTFLRAF